MEQLQTTKLTGKKEVRLIGISGKIKSGKDTVSEIIRTQLARERGTFHSSYTGHDWAKITEKMRHGASGWEIKKFAGLLKKWTAEAIGCTVEQLEDQEFKNLYLGDEWSYTLMQKVAGKPTPQPIKYRLRPRDILQSLGTEVGRSVHSNFWVNALFSQWNETSKWIITDVRFPNEAGNVLERGGILIRVERSSLLRLGLAKEPSNVHISERALDDWPAFTHVIHNNGSLQELEKNVLEIMKQYAL